MSLFGEQRTFPKSLPDLQPVIRDFVEYFHLKDYEVDVTPRVAGGRDISLTKGGIFKAVCGLRTALKMEVETRNNTTWVRLSVGLFGRELIPSAISLLVFWPILVTQIWGLVRQANLNDEAFREFSVCLDRHAGYLPTPSATVAAPTAAVCGECHCNLPLKAAFCPHCGAKVGQ